LTESASLALNKQGWRVIFLDCNASANQGNKNGVSVRSLDGFSLSSTQRVPGIQETVGNQLAERVRRALEQLHELYHFDLIQLPVYKGLGFRVIQAKRAGLAFGDVPIIVNLERASPCSRDQEARWPESLFDFETDFRERYSFERADVQLATNPGVLKWVIQSGWKVRENVFFGNLPEDPGALEEFYSKMAQEGASESITVGNPLVTVAIPHFNLGRFLPESLASLARQTYTHLEILVIDDGSTDPDSLRTLEKMERRYPQIRFLRQRNAGIGATRNRGLREARGEFFLPMDADNVARPDMVERFVSAISRNPELAAASCYFLAFRETADLERGPFCYAYRPIGGPFVLASVRNVYGDANAIFRTAAFRSVGGYEMDRDSSWEDWEAFVKLVRQGHEVDVVPEVLFYYRHLDSGFSRITSPYRNQRRVLRQFFAADSLSGDDRTALWSGLVGLHQRVEELEEENRQLRRQGGFRWLLSSSRRAWRLLADVARRSGRGSPARRGKALPEPRPLVTSR
jgi:glycosyltransferase involved in cell wall biosynthesis